MNSTSVKKATETPCSSDTPLSAESKIFCSFPLELIMILYHLGTDFPLSLILGLTQKTNLLYENKTDNSSCHGEIR